MLGYWGRPLRIQPLPQLRMQVRTLKEGGLLLPAEVLWKRLASLLGSFSSIFAFQLLKGNSFQP